jgi:sugar lactone lactonase YvrE
MRGRLVVPAALAAALVVAQAAAGGAASMRTVATHLNNPRQMEVGPDGALYIAEAGAAGHVKCIKGPEGKNCAGFSGAVIRATSSGQEVYAAGFVSGGDPSGNFTTGIDDVAVSPGGTVYGIVTAFGPDPNVVGPKAAEQLGNVMRIDRGAKTKVANVSSYEFEHNPAGDNKDSDPYGIAWADGGLLVADAAANSLLRVSLDGNVSTVATFPAQAIGSHYAQSVPTSVVVGPDGAYYVGELGGDAPPGHARIWRGFVGQKPTVWKTGFSTINGLAFGPDGSLYVSELNRGGLGGLFNPKGDPHGAVVRIWPDGHRTEIAKGQLIAPGGVAVGPDGTVYVSVNSVFRNHGQVVAISQ